MKKKDIILKNVILILTVAALVLIDQWTKHIAVSSLKGKEGVSFIGDLIVWQYAENKGAAFSILQGQQWPLTIVSLIITIGIVVLYELSTPGKRYLPLRIAYIGIIAGALGNMIDRIKLNYVVDFIYVKIIDFPIFNVADICVTCSCICLIILFIFIYKENDSLTVLKKKKEEKEKEASNG